MTLRYARHTTNLQQIEQFYTEIVRLEKLGEFQNHQTYDGIFLGHPNLNWHLEFTRSNTKPDHKFDGDDILVFYVNSEVELSAIRQKINKNCIKIEVPKNPYWHKNGIMISDPDGFKIIFSVKHIPLSSNDPLTALVREKAIATWSELIDFTKDLPYGRNQNRHDYSLVLHEMKGSCSSKHSFLKKVAALNKIENVKLFLGVYKMNHLNTPKIEQTIVKSGLKYIPEAHCYLKLNNERFDLTTANASLEHITNDLLEEIEIEPEQVNTFKVEFHKDYLKKWLQESAISLGFEKVWEIREACIKKLEK